MSSAKHKELIQSLRAALEATPQAVPLRKHLADLLMESGEFEEATKEYRRALDLAPEDGQIKLALAQAYYEQGKEDVALVILEELMRGLNPPAQAFLLATHCYLKAGDLKQATRAYRQAIAHDPNLADEELEKQLPLEDIEEQPGGGAVGDLVFVAADEDVAGIAGYIERPRISFKDVGGMEQLKEEIRMKIIYPLTHPEVYKAYGKTMGGGILMYGPPGCGKTYLARATAGEVQANFMPIGLHDVLDMWIGQSEKNLHAAFEVARSNTPCVLFFDEVDALGASRADMRYSSGRKTINQFLSEMDGVATSNEGVLILAATNAPWHLDSAFRRPGRFDRVLFVPPPDTQARAVILQILLADKPTERIDYGKLAQAANGFSGADLKGAVDRAVESKLSEAMRKGRPVPLSTRDLLAVIKTVRPTTSEWFETARNYALYSNESGLYDDILDYLKISGGRVFARRTTRDA